MKELDGTRSVTPEPYEPAHEKSRNQYSCPWLGSRNP